MSLTVEVICGRLVAIQGVQVLLVFCHESYWGAHLHLLPLGDKDAVHVAVLLRMHRCLKEPGYGVDGRLLCMALLSFRNEMLGT